MQSVDGVHKSMRTKYEPNQCSNDHFVSVFFVVVVICCCTTNYIKLCILKPCAPIAFAMSVDQETRQRFSWMLLCQGLRLLLQGKMEMVSNSKLTQVNISMIQFSVEPQKESSVTC